MSGECSRYTNVDVRSHMSRGILWESVGRGILDPAPPGRSPDAEDFHGGVLSPFVIRPNPGQYVPRPRIIVKPSLNVTREGARAGGITLGCPVRVLKFVRVCSGGGRPKLISSWIFLCSDLQNIECDSLRDSVAGSPATSADKPSISKGSRSPRSSENLTSTERSTNIGLTVSTNLVRRSVC